jgi:hypothetical protein
MENGTSSAVCIPFTLKQTDQLKMRTEAAVLQHEDQIRNETKTQHLRMNQSRRWTYRSRSR